MSRICNKVPEKNKKGELRDGERLRDTSAKSNCVNLGFGSDSNKSSIKAFLRQMGKTEYRLAMT